MRFHLVYLAWNCVETVLTLLQCISLLGHNIFIVILIVSDYNYENDKDLFGADS